MVSALIGRKVGMTQVYDEAGVLKAVTVLEVGPCDVVQIKTPEKDKYQAVQIAFGEKKEKRTSRPMLGHLAKAGVGPRRVLREVEVAGDAVPEPGQQLTVSVFEAGDLVDVVGTTRGMGYTGLIKRHGFHGGNASHGAKTHRHSGSIGPGTWPARTMKGRKMSGHHGDLRRTVKNLSVVGVDTERNLLLVGGAVPGSKNSIVVVRHATSAPKAYREARAKK